ncbi:CHAT domain-containing protein [Mycena latifolia]|nr:CHAT domain-containing protein [Mycena latifolia]
MDNCPPDFPTSLADPNQQGLSELLNRADNNFKKCMGESNLADLDTAIYLLSCAAYWADPNPQSSECLTLLTNTLLLRFNYIGKWLDVQHAGIIRGSTMGTRMSLKPIFLAIGNDMSPGAIGNDLFQVDDNPDDMVSLARSIINSFSQGIEPTSLDNAIMFYQEAVSKQELVGLDQARSLRRLGIAHLIRWHFASDVEDLQQAISVLQRLHLMKPNYVSCLCAALLAEHQITNLKDIGQLLHGALMADREAVQLSETILTDPDAWLKDDQGIDIMVSTLTPAALTLSWGHHSWTFLAQNLAFALQTRGDPADLDSAIGLNREVLDLEPAPHPNRPYTLNNLAGGLDSRFQERGDQADLDNAIELYYEAVDLLPAPHAARGSCLVNLANALHKRFQRGSASADLDSVIRLYHEVLTLSPAPDPTHTSPLIKLANALNERFQIRGNTEDLDSAIKLNRQVLHLQPAPDADRSTTLNNLAVTFFSRFQRIGFPADIESAIELYCEVLELQPITHPDRGSTLNNLAAACGERFRHMGDTADLDNAIRLYHEALDLQVAPTSGRGNALRNLAVGLTTRFETRGVLDDLDRAIALNREALDLLPDTLPERGSAVTNLGTMLHVRFRTTGDRADLDASIMLYHEALQLQSPPHPDRDFSLSNLATALYTRFQTRGGPEDLDSAILLHREALALQPAPHPERKFSLSGLANSMYERFQTRGDPRDLESAIGLYREVLNLQPGTHPDRGKILSGLAAGLHRQFEKMGDPDDLDNVITMHRETLDLRPVPHIEGSASLTNLANALHQRFSTRGDPADLDSAVDMHHEALELEPAPRPEHDSALSNLADVLHERFKTRGDPGDLDTAIELSRKALDLRPAPHPKRGSSLTGLGNVLYTRFKFRRILADLNSAIGLHYEALNLWPTPHPRRSHFLRNLGAALSERFNEMEDPTDIESAIGLYRQALELQSPTDPERGGVLNNLAAVVSQRDNPTSLQDAIGLYHEALNLFPAPHPARCSCLHNLALAYHELFLRTSSLADLEKAIGLHREALNLQPAPHPERGPTLIAIAVELCLKYDDSLGSSVMQEAIDAFREGSTYLSSSVFLRSRTSAEWAKSAAMRNHDSALEAYEASIELLPQLAMLGLDIQARHKALTSQSNSSTASDAAACASQLQKLGKAVEFLEAGRSVFWSQALQLHTPLDDLHSAHPELAQRVSTIARELEVGSHREVSSIRRLSPQHKDHAVLDEQDTHYRKLNAAWVEALQEVRQLPGFERFLRPKLLQHLCKSAHNGHVVILNASKFSCTALVVTPSYNVHCVQLEKMTWDRAQFLVKLLRVVLSGSAVHISQFFATARESSTEHPQLQDRLEGKPEDSVHYNPNTVFRRLLGELWTSLVEPVVRALDLKKSDSPGRLWWCPTGPLTFLPIHAAGRYEKLESDCVSDYAVSSYTPTLTSLLSPPTENVVPFKMTALIEPNAPDSSPLPGTEEEMKRIQQNVPKGWLTGLGNRGSNPATMEIVLRHLRESSMVHFACHGTQDLKNPLDSSLLLTSGRLKVSELMRENDNWRSRRSMRLAFLSACETARGDETLPDEAMHLAATMLFAGFRGVVATMWRMADLDGPKIADTFYEQLFKGCDATADPPIPPDLLKAAEALHIAVKKLRADPNVSFSRWVPFVHYGL